MAAIRASTGVHVRRTRRQAAVALLGALGLLGQLHAKDFVVVGSYGNSLHIIDPDALKVVKSIAIATPGNAPLAIVPSSDGRVVYAVTNAWSTIVGINVDTGKEEFRADLGEGSIRARAYAGLDLSPDGKELYVAQMRWQEHSDRYEVLSPGIAVYSTDGGRSATPTRILPAPRRVMGLAVSADGRTVYANSYDLHVIDSATGTVRDIRPIVNWKSSQYGPPDQFNLWGFLNVGQVFVHPLFTVPAGQEGPVHLGLLSVDLRSGEVATDVLEPLSTPAVFVAAVNPARRNEVFAVGHYLYKIDRTAKKVLLRVPAGQIFYAINVSTDGTKVFTGGGICNVGIFAAEDLTRLGVVQLPHCTDQGFGTLRVINRPDWPR